MSGNKNPKTNNVKKEKTHRTIIAPSGHSLTIFFLEEPLLISLHKCQIMAS